ncbi:redox-regulated ATPase YchF [Candidatus Odyssella acanthamoebae]|uniref:Ribosome-binding ATPase YchF n=1 Tax=Candidatus Odyssella acanthamoebae TaxID=91604 RepID=A0A077AYL0_9PROT|nr:redox-regulated ATPase YchF [Candidatus Paracaedibacter acanthamoebae]AIK96713.1 GTP-binding protein [Candidatus Paracaedibacter acanthamoebae]
MGFNCGIVGLPNVGKSTLFNALTATAAAEAANYPFCTIEPNTGRVGVPDPRLFELAKIAQSQKIIPTQLEFVDIAGLVRGASKGEGLGNQFLGHIRSVDAIIHVLRCFENDDITHVDGSVDPLRDLTTIETELMLADMESLERRVQGLEKKAKGGDAESKALLGITQKVLKHLEEGKMANTFEVSKDEKPLFDQLQLLTSKPILYVCNVSEEEAATGNAHTAKVAAYAQQHGTGSVIISAAIEAEVSSLESEEEQLEFLQSLGLQETGLKQVIREGYKLLDLLTFFTIGPKEARAWTTYKGAKAPQAAGEIHTDFERGFICAETTSYEDYIACNGETGAKAAGKMRLEGRDYIAKDGDIFHFRFNV